MMKTMLAYFGASFLGTSWIWAQGVANPPATAPWVFDVSTLRPFTDGVPYLGKFETGLYPGGKNDIPDAHRKAGEKIAASIEPLNDKGEPDAQNGRILALVFGHSNTKVYFGRLAKDLEAHKAELHPRFELINAAESGNLLKDLVGYRYSFQGAVWKLADEALSRPGYSPKQVQVLFLHTTAHGHHNLTQAPPGPFPDELQQMQKDVAILLEHCVKVYPNLKIAYLTCDGLRQFTQSEPHVWREAFAFKWLIESQINGTPGTAFEDKEGAPRKLPWLEWGPYIWDNTWDRSYFQTDGVHPNTKALDAFAAKYWQHLTTDSITRNWLMKGAQPKAPGAAK